MFRIVALICALGQDPADCQPPTARSIVALDFAASELDCALSMQRRAASIPDRINLAPGEWLKFTCRRR